MLFKKLNLTKTNSVTYKLNFKQQAISSAIARIRDNHISLKRANLCENNKVERTSASCLFCLLLVVVVVWLEAERSAAT